MNKSYDILKAIVKECKKHLFRLNQANHKIQPSLPITPEKVFNLSDEETEHIDQFIFRFSKLQDAVGQKLFNSVLVFLGEDVSNKSAIDVFNRLEQLGIIKNYDSWKELRNIRNELAHEYEEDKAEAAEKLNIMIEKKTQLEQYFNDILQYLVKKGYNIDKE